MVALKADSDVEALLARIVADSDVDNLIAQLEARLQREQTTALLREAFSRWGVRYRHGA
jgi:hypothetical protein